MVRQVVYVGVVDIDDADERTKALEAACNWDWLAAYPLIAATPYMGNAAGPARTHGFHLFFEKD